MARKTINLFMWGYQQHFRSSFRSLASEALKQLGVEDIPVKCFLIGSRMPNSDVTHNVCVEPEDGEWALDLFSGLHKAIEKSIHQHPSRNMFYTHGPTMQDLPERVR